MNKVERDGKVAVLYSPSFGSGWYSWSSVSQDILFDPTIVEWVELRDKNRRDSKALEIPEKAIREYIDNTYPDMYIGSNFIDLKIYWIDKGTVFRVDEYEGKESIVEFDMKGCIVA